MYVVYETILWSTFSIALTDSENLAMVVTLLQVKIRSRISDCGWWHWGGSNTEDTSKFETPLIHQKMVRFVLDDF